jgi:hypothetical protein
MRPVPGEVGPGEDGEGDGWRCCMEQNVFVIKGEIKANDGPPHQISHRVGGNVDTVTGMMYQKSYYHELEKNVALRADLVAALAESDALKKKYENPEPGQLIAEISCPSCGRELRVEHGDDEGEIGVLTNDK